MKGFVVAIVGVVAMLQLSCNRVTDAAASLLISPEQEAQMGQNFANQIQADTVNYPPYSKKAGANPALIKYIDSIGQRIVASQQKRTDITFQFTVIDNDTTVNAFAVPGGFVYIYTGVIKKAHNEDEIAGVLAHEIGHVTNRHGVNTLLKQNGLDFVMDMVLGDSSGLRSVADVVTNLGFLKYSRANEFQADSCGVEYTLSGGWNPAGMESFLQILKDMSASSLHFDWLSTHPDTQDRIDEVHALIVTKPTDVQSRTLTNIRVTP
jgi:predicted Zn-dependent protease